MKWRVYITAQPGPNVERQFVGNVVREKQGLRFYPANEKADATWLRTIKRHVIERCEHWDRKFSSSWDENTFVEITSI